MTMPKCDGSHKFHNQLTGDHLGPLVVVIETPTIKNQSND